MSVGPRLDEPRFLAIIPARGGSKGVPRKNIMPLAGKPLICYTIGEARDARHLDRVVVSTDDEEIAKLSQEMGSEVILRPPELATDTAPTEPVVIHLLQALEMREGYRPDIVVTLEPTSPLRTYQTIDACIERLVASGADSVLTIAENRDCLGTINDGSFRYLFPNQPRRDRTGSRGCRDRAFRTWADTNG